MLLDRKPAGEAKTVQRADAAKALQDGQRGQVPERDCAGAGWNPGSPPIESRSIIGWNGSKAPALVRTGALLVVRAAQLFFVAAKLLTHSPWFWNTGAVLVAQPPSLHSCLFFRTTGAAKV